MSLCESIDTLAMAYLDGELAAEEKHELETHLTECTSCRAEVDTARTDQELLRISLAAPRASDSMRMRLGKALDTAEQAEASDIRSAKKRKLSSLVLPGSAILAAAAAILVFVGVGFTPPGDRVGSIAKQGLRQQTRGLPLEAEGPRTQEWLHQVGMEAPNVAGSQLLGWQPLPDGVWGHDATIFAYDVPLNGRRIVLNMLVIHNITQDQMSDGDELTRNGRTMHLLRLEDGRFAVTYVDKRHRGFSFLSEQLSEDELVDLISVTGLVQ